MVPFPEPVRCGNCHNCKKIERSKATMLRVANPPFSHVTDDMALLWNDMLLNCPCHTWTLGQMQAEEAKILSVSPSIRPELQRPCRVRVTFDLTFERKKSSTDAILDTVKDVANKLGNLSWDRDLSACVVRIDRPVELVDTRVSALATAVPGEAQEFLISQLEDQVRDAVDVLAQDVNSKGLAAQLEVLIRWQGYAVVRQLLAQLMDNYRAERQAQAQEAHEPGKEPPGDRKELP